MKKIFVRSPYFLEFDGLVLSTIRLEIKLWHKGEAIPSTPQYIITEKVPSASQNKISINVSNYAKDFIKPVAPVNVSVPTEEDVKTWCYMRVASYLNNTLLGTENFVCLNGYANYMGGYNNYNENSLFLLTNHKIKIHKESNNTYLNIFINVNISTQLLWYNDNYYFDLDCDEPSLLKIPILGGGLWNLDFDGHAYNFNVEQLCEPKYTPITCTFINRYGGWQFLTFFKANTQSIEVKSKDFKMMPNSVDYNPLQGQTKRFNFQGTQKIKCNTGWVDENYSELIQDLLLSEVVLLDNKPAIVKSQSFDIKTHLKDKNINYEIEFEYNYGLVNDVI